MNKDILRLYIWKSRSTNILLRYSKMKYTPKCIYENTPILFNLLLFYFMHPKCIDNIISKRNGFQSSHKMTKWLIKRHNSHKATHHLSFEIAQNQKNKNFANCAFKKEYSYMFLKISIVENWFQHSVWSILLSKNAYYYFKGKK